MDAVVVERAAVDRLRVAFAREGQLFEVRRNGGEADWMASRGEEPFDWNALQALAGVKRFFFPPHETLLAWDGGDACEVLPVPVPFVLFGLRACDLAAVAVQDRFFAADPWYARRRERALLVGRNCLAACEQGFCHDVAAGPFARSGFDLCCTPMPDGRVVLEIGTPAGRAALLAAGVHGAPVDAGLRRSFASVLADAEGSFASRPWIARALARMDRASATDEEWAALAPSCLSCTGCTSLCPTCSCYTVADEPRPEGGVRVRHWDSCLLEGFQREASGHHPAPRPADRVRRFWEHKLSPAFVPVLGRLGCVGCGRCETTCPGGIGALSVLHALGRA